MRLRGRAAGSLKDALRDERDTLHAGNQGICLPNFIRLAGCIAVVCSAVMALRRSPNLATGDDVKEIEYGLSVGNYSFLHGITCRNCASKLGYYCGYNATGATEPPAELLRPGKLGQRHDLSLWSQCFLWYCNTWWSRRTGGAHGLMFYKMGDVDNKDKLRQWLQAYDEQHACPPFQITPVTISLSDRDTCRDFYSNNSRWAPSDASMWFIKDSNGSQGTHIKLRTRRQIEAMWRAQESAAQSSRAEKKAWERNPRHPSRLCPNEAHASVASLSVQQPWLIDGYKFDNRIYVLVASVTPLIVLFHSGHLRFSQVKYQDHDPRPESADAPFKGQEARGGKGKEGDVGSGGGGGVGEGITRDEQGRKEWLRGVKAAGWVLEGDADIEKDKLMGMHVTNPRFGLAHTNDTRRVIRPIQDLWRDLLRQHDEARARPMWKRLQTSVRNAALQAVYASRPVWFGHGGYTAWGYALLAMDVAFDQQMNAYILDVNSGPSFYHILPPNNWPKWFGELRSATIREAYDILQEVASRKIQDTGSLRSQASTWSQWTWNHTITRFLGFRDAPHINPAQAATHTQKGASAHKGDESGYYGQGEQSGGGGREKLLGRGSPVLRPSLSAGLRCRGRCTLGVHGPWCTVR